MKLRKTRHTKINQAIGKLQIALSELAYEKKQCEFELEKYVRRHRSLAFDGLETDDVWKLQKIYAYFDARYPIDFQGGLRCDERGMHLCYWVDDDPDYLILHLSSTSKNICFSGSTSWQVKAQTLADKVEILAKIKKDVRRILDGTEN